MMKITESQLRNIIRNTLNEMMYEGRPRVKPSYWEIEDYQQVPGVDLVIDLNAIKRMKNPKWRNPDNLIKALENEAIDMRVDEQNLLHAYFYHGNNQKYIEYDLAEDERFWYEVLGEPSMKGIAKQVPVMLYEHVPDFEEIWNESRDWYLDYRSKEAAGDKHYGKGDRETVYNTIPTLRGGGTVDN